MDKKSLFSWLEMHRVTQKIGSRFKKRKDIYFLIFFIIFVPFNIFLLLIAAKIIDYRVIQLSDYLSIVWSISAMQILVFRTLYTSMSINEQMGVQVGALTRSKQMLLHIQGDYKLLENPILVNPLL